MKPCPLLQDPCWQAAHLGRPLPDSEHATSVAMPLWRHVVEYEEGNPELIRQLALGYPRFVVHPNVVALNQEALRRFGKEGEGAFVAPSQRVAENCQRFIHDVRGVAARVQAMEGGVFAVLFPSEVADTAKHFWQHYGEIVSSRRARAILNSASVPAGDDGSKARIREQIAGLTGCEPDDVYLYSTGMAALAAALRVAQRLHPGARSIQFGFPYVDGLKIQTVWGPGAHFHARLQEELPAVEEIIRSGEPLSALFCEVVGNPLLSMPDVPRLSALLRERDIPFVVDDTVATFANVDLLPYADMISSSLTKHFSGAGDVMAGSLILNRKSPRYADLKATQEALFEDLFWHEDATVLADNAQDFDARIARINLSTEALCEQLRAHPAVAEVYYPKFTTNVAYESVKRPGGGYGGLFSLVLKDAARTSQPYFDLLRVSKGPSLGTNFTLACPYTLLAHFKELDWAESLGISRHLIRVSVGLEDLDDLLERFLSILPR